MHCRKPEYLQEEEAMGNHILKEAIDRYVTLRSDCSVPPALIVISYETLAHVGPSYLNFLLRQLQLPLIHEPMEWAFHDGNARYVLPQKEILKSMKGTKALNLNLFNRETIRRRMNMTRGGALDGRTDRSWYLISNMANSH